MLMQDTDRKLALFLRAATIGLFAWMVRGILIPVVLGALFALLRPILSPEQIPLVAEVARRVLVEEED